jgi:hypothetical protein
MSMMPELPQQAQADALALIQSSVVVLAKDVNQSIFSPVWLLKNGILLEEEVRPEETVFVPGLTRVNTANFEFMALPDRLQMQFPASVYDADTVLARVLGGVAKILPHTPFVAVGLNNHFVLKPTDASHFAEWNRAIFASPWALRQATGTARDRFGTSFAYDAFGGARMRVRAAVSAESTNPSEGQAATVATPPYVVNLHCNLHRDLQLPNVEVSKELPRMLALWKLFREETARIARSLLQ